MHAGSIPPELGGLSTLTNLDLSENKLSGKCRVYMVRSAGASAVAFVPRNLRHYCAVVCCMVWIASCKAQVRSCTVFVLPVTPVGAKKSG